MLCYTVLRVATLTSIHKGVIGMAELLLDTELCREQREHAECIQVSAQNLLLILNDILDFSRIEAGRMQLEDFPFGLANLISNLMKTLSYAARRKGILLNCALDDPLDLHLSGDVVRIRQILTNLLSNAIKFTNEGSVELRTAVVETPDKAVVTFTVADVRPAQDHNPLLRQKLT